MEALGPGDDRASPASSTGSLDLQRLSTRADSAYSSFSAASGGPEARTPSPSTPYLDWEYVRVVWGGPSPAPRDADSPTAQRPRPAVAACCGPRPPEVQGTPGPLSKQATPLLYALTAEAEAGARAAEPPSPPASRAAYRQRLQGAQRRVLRETSFQRKELRMSLPTRLRPAVLARPPTAHPRSASLSHPGGEVGSARSRAPAPGATGPRRLASQQRKWCFSEPGKLDRVGRGGGPTGECLSLACSSSGLISPEPQELQRGALAEVKGLPETQSPNTGELDSGSLKLRDACRPASRSQSASGEVLGPWSGPGGAIATVQAVSQAAENPRSMFQTRLSSMKNFLPGHCGQCGIPASRFLTQKGTALMHPAENPQSSPAKCEQRVSEICMESASAWLPSLPHDEVFLEETPHVRMRSDSLVPQGFPTSVHASDQQCGTGLGQSAGQASVPAECSLHKGPGTTGADDCWQGMNGSVGICRPTSCIPPGTANGDISIIDPSGLLTTDHPAVDALEPSGSDNPGSPHCTSLAWGTGQHGSRPTWQGQRLEELVQELARLDPSLGDTLTSQPSPEPPLGLLDGLIPLVEVWAAMRPACGEAGEEAAGTFEPGSYQFSFTQLLPTSQEEIKPENSPSHPVPDHPSAQGPPASNNSIQAKKVELVGLLQKMLQDLHVQEEMLQGAAQEWTRRRAALETTVGRACAPRELERFSRFMADLERVLGLLLLLGSRLARVHHALARVGSDGDPDERASLLQRLGLLQQQQEDAKELKEHVARRERTLREVLARALTAEELRSYSELLASKATILAQQRSLDERVRLLQNQLDALGSDLGHRPLSPRPSWPPGTCPRDKPPFLPPSI